MTSEDKGFNNLSFIGSDQIKANNTTMTTGGKAMVAVDGNLMKQPLKKANTFPYQVLQNNDSTTSYSSSASADSDSYAEEANVSGPSDIVKNKRISSESNTNFERRL